MNIFRNLFGRKNALDFAKKQKAQLLVQRKKWADRMAKDSEEIRKAQAEIERLEQLILNQRAIIRSEVESKGGKFQEYLSIQAQINEQDATIQKLSS